MNSTRTSWKKRAPSARRRLPDAGPGDGFREDAQLRDKIERVRASGYEAAFHGLRLRVIAAGRVGQPPAAELALRGIPRETGRHGLSQRRFHAVVRVGGHPDDDEIVPSRFGLAELYSGRTLLAYPLVKPGFGPIRAGEAKGRCGDEDRERDEECGAPGMENAFQCGCSHDTLKHIPQRAVRRHHSQKMRLTKKSVRGKIHAS